MSERLKNTKNLKPARKHIMDYKLFERSEKELPRFREFRHLMKVSHQLGIII
jgi:hypothetical protein